MKKDFMTIQDLFDKAGGAYKLAGELNVHQYSVERWSRIGIPSKYWKHLIKKYKCTADQLLEMSELVRTKRK